MSKPKKNYALFAAVNDYAHISKLKGCVNDAKRVTNYLTKAAKEQGNEFHCVALHNDKATKQNITQHILKHLGQATEEDICLFYFSGHGGQETTHPAFKNHESDGKIEVIACYDSNLKDSGSFLADKEIRYLIRKLYDKTQSDIITVFDCCHSGGNTRSTKLAQRRLMDDADGRKWEDFVFAKEVTQAMVENATALEEVLPQGRHLQMAACEDKQVAWEVAGGGVFSTNFISLLRQTKGDISYQDLINLMRLRIGYRYKQTPQVYATGDKNLVHRSFLGGITEHQKHIANIGYDQKRRTWALDMGAIHGIRKDNPKLEINLLDSDGNVKERASITNVLPDSTHLTFSADDLVTELVYKAAISGVIVSPLGLYAYGDEEGVATFKEFFQKNSKEVEGLELVEFQQSADYLIHSQGDYYSVQSSRNDLAVVKDYMGRDSDALKKLAAGLKHIGQWVFVKDLDNPDTNIRPNPPIDLEIYRKNAEGEVLVNISNNVGEMKFADVPPENNLMDAPSGEMRICLKNNSNQSYYCALLYLSQDFAVIPNLLEGGTEELLPNKQIWVQGGQAIPYSLESFIRQFNWEEETHYLQLIMSTQPFDVSRLSQESLPLPDASDTRGTSKGVSFGKRKAANLTDWCTHLVELRMTNPYFKLKEDQ